MGRPTKLTPERIKILVDAVAAGNYYETACALAGITYRTFAKWREKGERAKSGIYFQFVQDLKRAEAFAEAERIKRIREAAKEGNWQADAWWLERRYPERWGRRAVDVSMKQEVSGQVELKHDGSIALDLATNEGFLRALQEALASGASTIDLGSLPGPMDSGQDRGKALEEAGGDSAGLGDTSQSGGSKL
ncbi:MAG: hypothetical protein IMX00_04305 [Limnochordales bacterium]|nr:hypothetical protein [Limnochordales bacterium]